MKLKWVSILKSTGQLAEGDVFIDQTGDQRLSVSQEDFQKLTANLIEDETSWQLGQAAADRSEGEGGDDHQRQQNDPQHHERRDVI